MTEKSSLPSPTRCPWPGEDGQYLAYHDGEWGYPVGDDFALFEKICLEGFQSGLSWLTILRKRDNFRVAFEGFDFDRIRVYGDTEIDRLLGNAGIVRHRGKILATINNAARAVEMRKEFGSLAAYFWAFEPSERDRPDELTWEVLKTMGTTDASVAMAKDLKKRGWSFVGATTCYAFMQAMGIVNDHVVECHFRDTVEAARAGFERPARTT
ncbi:MAG: DNA-3-methyladenine glycosylase I [Alphaproteobacteria bacterium]|nr:DNA-3-methyladenine glycosylase I [Alphaproteobacteria bacterium]